MQCLRLPGLSPRRSPPRRVFLRFSARCRLGGQKAAWRDMSVSDGGLYDNLGLQPVDRHGVVLVSDGGQPFVAAVPRGMFGRAKAYLAVSGKQAGALRKRLLIGQFSANVKQGTYWGIDSAVCRYSSGAQPGYGKAFATATIASIRTDMDAFSEAEIAVLMNHGYLLADIASAVHTPQLIAHAAQKQVPFPHWMDEDRAGAALAAQRGACLAGSLLTALRRAPAAS